MKAGFELNLRQFTMRRYCTYLVSYNQTRASVSSSLPSLSVSYFVIYTVGII